MGIDCIDICNVVQELLCDKCDKFNKCKNLDEDKFHVKLYDCLTRSQIMRGVKA